MNQYHSLSENEIRQKLNHSLSPLTDEQVYQHQQIYGKNEITENHKKPLIRIFFEQFLDFLVGILLVAAIVSGILGNFESAIVIVIVITINAILGTIQTVKAEASIKSLQKLSTPIAKVLRNNTIVAIPSSDLTLGDEILIEAGDAIPADGRIISSSSLKIDESMLTGESISVEKNNSILPEKISISDRINMVYSGCIVTYGKAKVLITDIGNNTEVGKIATLIKNTSERKTPLQINLDKFGKKLSILILIFCTILFAINILRGENIADTFLFAIALAVAAIPEALSSIVTIVLSFGTQKMVKECAIIKKLQAVESLGCVSVICSDKTGTLTQNKMTVTNYFTNEIDFPQSKISFTDENQKQLLLSSILCNDASIENNAEIGDPTETALLIAAKKSGINIPEIRKQYSSLSCIPFDSERKLMSSLHKIDSEFIMFTKGAVDILINKLTSILVNGEIINITDKDKKQILFQNEEYSKKGLRVLAYCLKKFDSSKELSTDDECNYTFIGLSAMIDPPRQESTKAVKECIDAGIIPIMITGDHKITATAIAKSIGILQNDSEVCEGYELDNLSDDSLDLLVEKIRVYARVTPEHKIRIVNSWQRKGFIVAMTGDGVNDAPALKQADVGVAMGITGTEAAKQAASMILTDDNFSSIVKAIENGRNVYANIKKSILFLLSGNFGAIVAVLYASIVNLPVPFAAVHLLFINLLTDSLPAISLGLEPHNLLIMKDKPRSRTETILTKDFLIRICFEGLIIGLFSIIGFYYGYKTNGPILGSTMAFGVLCLARLFHGYNCKSNKPILFTKSFFNNIYIQFSFIIGLVLISCVLYFPIFTNAFSVQTLTVNQLLIVYGLAFSTLPIIQFFKLLYTIKDSVNLNLSTPRNVK